MSRPPFPSPDEGLVLHLRRLEYAADSSADVCGGYLDPLIAWLEDKHPRADPDFRRDAAIEAIVSYVGNPNAYDADKLDLGAYLRMAAHRDLLNLLRGEQRHHRARVAWSVVENDPDGGNLIGRDEEPPALLEKEEETERWQTFFRELRESMTEQERKALDLMRDGVGCNRVYAEALGLTGLVDEERDREVKRVKDRIKKRIERGGKRHE